MTTPIKQTKDTKTALLENAELLFLARGFENVSIRQITERSDANVAAINYHFKGKTNLYREVLTRRLDKITAEKLALLDETVNRKPAASLEQLISAYVRSHFDSHLASTDSERLLQLIYHEMGPDAIAGDLVAERLVIPIHLAFQKAILKICPELDERHVSYCISSIMGQILHFIRAREALKIVRGPEHNPSFIDDAIQHITQFSLRGIRSNYHV